MRVYLSPHHDDVCFSIGHLAAREGGVVVNVFTRSAYAAVPVPRDERDRIGCITELRREEDRLFAAAAGLAREEIGLDETSALGLGSFDHDGIDGEIALLRDRLVGGVHRLLPANASPQNSALFCPMGIGGHRNHVSILHAVRDAYEGLARRCTVWLYEDLHYASDPSARRRGIAHARQLFSGVALKAAIVKLDAASARRKLDWIRLYRSQHGKPVEAARFTPATGLEGAMHEMVYRCENAM